MISPHVSERGVPMPADVSGKPIPCGQTNPDVPPASAMAAIMEHLDPDWPGNEFRWGEGKRQDAWIGSSHSVLRQRQGPGEEEV